jgi:hypothetical protein
MANKVKRMRQTRDPTDESVKYAILCENGVDQKVYHVDHVWLALKFRSCWPTESKLVKMICHLKKKLLWGTWNIFAKHPTTDLASIQETKEKVMFFGCIQHCYDHTFGLLWRTQKNSTLRKNWVVRCNWYLGFYVPATLHIQKKGSIRDSKVAWPCLLWSTAAINTPWPFLPLHGRPHKKAQQDWQADRRHVWPPERLWVLGGEQNEMRST